MSRTYTKAEQEKIDFFNRHQFDRKTLQPICMAERATLWERHQEGKKEWRKLIKERDAALDHLKKTNPVAYAQLKEFAEKHAKPKPASAANQPKKEVPEQLKLWQYFCKLPQNKGLSQKEKSQRYRAMDMAERLVLENDLENEKYNHSE
jgi:hypothetical protein